jgi:hypothetical protein
MKYVREVLAAKLGTEHLSEGRQAQQSELFDAYRAQLQCFCDVMADLAWTIRRHVVTDLWTGICCPLWIREKFKLL